MEALNLVESFLVSAQAGSFSAAARRLGLTPAAVSKNVARLEAQLGVRLFHRSTRRLTLTDRGEQFLHEAGGPFDQLQQAFARAAEDDGHPAGTLKVSMGVAFGREYLVPLLGEFLRRYPAIVPDWQFDNRPADLVGGAFDAAIGGGIALNQGVVVRELAPAHVIAVAAPDYLAGRELPRHPADLACLEGIARRSGATGRLYAWTMRNRAGEQAAADYRARLVFDDPDAMAHAAMAGHGVALLPMAHAVRWLEQGALVRLLPDWYAELGAISLYYPNRRLLPPKTRVFIDFVVEAFRERGLAARFDARRP
ncbi:LysR family transcriptional regulator [Chitiniphilus shinanonensis]|uniref:LysR family transcriptional regulator n=1 Tax=Chitiniphilus shinanonensis TaxID=553088 RepID=UPI00301F5D74